MWKARRADESNELYHYGVKGMKWGVRKDKETSSRSKLGSGYEGLSDWLPKSAKKIKTMVGEAKIEYYDNWQMLDNKSFINQIKKEMPDRYAPDKVAKERFDNLPKFNMRLTEPDQIKATNHDAPSDIRGINCWSCTMAYEMRRRGYNVQARELASGWGPEAQRAFDIKDAFKVSIKSNGSGDKEAMAKECYRQIEQQCLAYGEGARGNLGIQYYDYPTGHAMNWVVENGEFKILNTQSNVVGGYELFLHAEVEDKDVQVYRLDNAEALPAVTDYVEEFEPTLEEREAAAKKKNKPTLDQVQRRNAIKKGKDKNAVKKVRAQDEATRDLGRSSVEKVLNKVQKATSSLISQGKSAIKNFLNIQEHTKITEYTTKITRLK